ncbi:hypothetical protein [Flammeovirga aprica]|uniref:Uncharacterized protein n=1 Tax=Flammeovirga aprica JL-4 TaxID=694437 RepID=A0A7X9RX63_9BACT|nr:hypothetical protein [Flammeovirga aprica]NME70325.1 hypothetical protein [Flammeovirga aprica JL-4]
MKNLFLKIVIGTSINNPNKSLEKRLIQLENKVATLSAEQIKQVNSKRKLLDGKVSELYLTLKAVSFLIVKLGKPILSIIDCVMNSNWL